MTILCEVTRVVVILALAGARGGVLMDAVHRANSTSVTNGVVEIIVA
jgi:hypothetical protein